MYSITCYLVAATVFSTVAVGAPPQLKKRVVPVPSSATLRSTNNDVSYTVEALIGENYLDLLVDTGSVDTYV